MASHDMQEPLRKIRAFSDMLLIRQRAVLNEDGKSTLQKIAKSSERLQNLINDLLAFSRLVNKNAQNVETVSLDTLLSEVLKDLSMLTIEKCNYRI
jgi:signal transduction histidine kinase